MERPKKTLGFEHRSIYAPSVQPIGIRLVHRSELLYSIFVSSMVLWYLLGWSVSECGTTRV